eukprot:8250036-Karenia_brevis.AAC.1
MARSAPELLPLCSEIRRLTLGFIYDMKQRAFNYFYFCVQELLELLRCWHMAYLQPPGVGMCHTSPLGSPCVDRLAFLWDDDDDDNDDYDDD